MEGHLCRMEGCLWKTVEIDHGYGFISRYGHNGAIWSMRVTKSKGRTDSPPGNTGNGTGPHLHFTILKTMKALTRLTICPEGRRRVGLARKVVD